MPPPTPAAPPPPCAGGRAPCARSTSRGRPGGRRPASWADPPPPPRRGRQRRAVCSWSVGYGALSELDELPTPTLHAKDAQVQLEEKVADQTTLLDPRGHRPVTAPTHSAAAPPPRRSRVESLLAMPGIKSVLGGRRRPADARDADHALSPLVGRRGGAVAAAPPPEIVTTPPAVRPASSLASLRKCETVLALTGYLRSSSSSSSFEPIRPVNRLRGSSQSRVCSRCSSLLTLASGSRYSLDTAAGGFARLPGLPAPPCKLCLADVPAGGAARLRDCGCTYCAECMRAYVEFEIGEGSYDISCPDALCPSQGVLRQEEIKRLVGSDLLEKHNMYRLNREVELDQTRTWCPSAGCETVCPINGRPGRTPQAVHCPTCARDFCSECKLEWHEGGTCVGAAGPPGIPFDSDVIKCCPMCSVPIEKDEGCAQMMCKRCKHVFCWYCLASLDDDFLLRHYDKGPCKNKLGHSRASVIWHRTQVIGIFAGFGILLLVASPLLLLAAPCIVCCKCRLCGGVNAKLEEEEVAAVAAAPGGS